jgi:AcrR family transcriptional regulator
VSTKETADRILRAFLSLAAERGLSAVTTRDIAAAAGVNEVTVFRHFGDKAALAREAVRRFSPAAELDAIQPRIDASSPEAARDGLRSCLGELQAQLAGHPELLAFGLGDAARYPDLAGDLREIPAAARRLLTRAFEQARSQLRDEVTIEAEVIGLLGMLLMLATWRPRHWTDLSDEQVSALLAARLRPLFRSGQVPGTRGVASIRSG